MRDTDDGGKSEICSALTKQDTDSIIDGEMLAAETPVILWNRRPRRNTDCGEESKMLAAAKMEK